MFGERIRDALSSLDRRELLGVIAIALLVVGGAAFWYVRSLPSPVRVEAAAAPSAVASAASAAPSPSPGVVIVHVAGWVRNPGVYELRQGDRVVDAIRRAGGARPGADLASINLAALLTDAEQIVVARATAGGPAGGAPGGTTTVPGSSTTSSGTSAGGQELVNVNTATLEELEELPGIGPALGQRIIDFREQNGPFESVDELLDVSGIGEQTLEDIKPYITV